MQDRGLEPALVSLPFVAHNHLLAATQDSLPIIGSCEGPLTHLLVFRSHRNAGCRQVAFQNQNITLSDDILVIIMILIFLMPHRGLVHPC